MRPTIGIMPLWDDEKQSIWMLPGYMDGVSLAGGLPVMLPFTTDPQELDQIVSMCDGFLFTGGHDVSPQLYHEEPLPGLVSCCPIRDRMEAAVLERAIKMDKSLLGICRGIQFLNAALGGNLYQDLPSQHPSDTEHHQAPPYDVPVHKVEIIADTPLAECLRVKSMSVNSYHHQAVRSLSPVLKPMAISSDGLVEALYMPGHRFLWAVQWHPEFSFQRDENSRKIFRAFVNAAI